MPDDARELPTDRLAEQLIALYVAAERRIELMLSESIGRGAKGTARHYQLQRIRLQAELERLRRASQAIEGPLTRSSYLSGTVAVDRTLNLSEAFTGVHGRAMEVLAGALSGELDTARRNIGREADDVFRQVGLQEVAVGIGTGRTGRETVSQIRRRLIEQGRTAFVDRGGRRWSLSQYASMVTRTTTREAVTEGTLNRLLDHGRDVVETSEHPGSCPICLPLQGRKFSITGRTKEYPKLPKWPPHPQCRHVVFPSTAEFEAFERELGLAQAEPAPPPAPEAEPHPEPAETGVSIETVIEPTGRTTKKDAEHALAAIDKVHTIPPDLPRIPTVTRSSMRAYGEFRWFTDGSAHEIRLNNSVWARAATGSVAAVTTHEIGHYLDWIAFRADQETAARGRQWYASNNSSVFDELIATARGTDKHKEILRDARLTQKFRRYVTNDQETVARAYSQWIALRSDDGELRAAVEKDRYQWSWEEFEPLAEILDRIFEERGWLRKKT